MFKVSSLFDPVRVAEDLEGVVCREVDGVFERSYWRFRGGKWYGGIATADCVGCNFSCVFCGPILYMTKKKISGRFFDPVSVVERLVSIASRRGYRYLRVGGGEPTICFEHLYQVLEVAQSYPFVFILETNGILLGFDRGLAERLSDFERVHIRVSIKGTSEEEFSKLTRAEGKFFQYQLRAIKYLNDANVSFHPALVASFSRPEDVKRLRGRIKEIDPVAAENLEVEYIVLYRHVVESLKKHVVKFYRAYTVNWDLVTSE